MMEYTGAVEKEIPCAQKQTLKIQDQKLFGH